MSTSSKCLSGITLVLAHVLITASLTVPPRTARCICSSMFSYFKTREFRRRLSLYTQPGLASPAYTEASSSTTLSSSGIFGVKRPLGILVVICQVFILVRYSTYSGASGAERVRQGRGDAVQARRVLFIFITRVRARSSQVQRLHARWLVDDVTALH